MRRVERIRLSGIYHLVDGSTAAVLAVKDNPGAATRSAGNISRRFGGRLVSVWLVDRTVRPGSCLGEGDGVLVAQIEHRRRKR